MIDFLQRLLTLGQNEGAVPLPPPAPSKEPTPLPLPEEVAKEYLDWFHALRKPAVALKPDPSLPIEPKGSRLFGPAFLPDSEEWPKGPNDVPLEMVAQVNLADCKTLEGYPGSGVLQFFIGRDDLYGADFDDLLRGNFLVRCLADDCEGSLHPVPPLEVIGDDPFSEYSPARDNDLRARGVTLVPEPIEDMIDLSVDEASTRFRELPDNYDLDPLYDALDELLLERSSGHHTGGYPAFVQADIREHGQYLEYDHVLLRLTSDKYLMWGDVGECVFMIPSADLAKAEFSRVVYSWDCS
ncbi:MAG: DUF1963 domain-containing protein [Pseudomonadota bacterium]